MTIEIQYQNIISNVFSIYHFIHVDAEIPKIFQGLRAYALGLRPPQTRPANPSGSKVPGDLFLLTTS